MKNLLVILFIALSSVVFGQGIKIKWEDNAGREFSIQAPNGDFSYGMIAGDNIIYDLNGRVSTVGTVSIMYNLDGQVSHVGKVSIMYDLEGRVSQVGGLMVWYDLNGRVSGTTGSVQ